MSTCPRGRTSARRPRAVPPPLSTGLWRSAGEAAPRSPWSVGGARCRHGTARIPAFLHNPSPACAQPRGTGVPALSTGSYPQAGAAHRRLSTGLCPTSARFGGSARCVAERREYGSELRCRPGFRAPEAAVALPTPAAEPDRVNGRWPLSCGQLDPQSFCQGWPGMRGGRKKIFDEFPEVIHRRGSKSVDNLVDNLWTTAPRLWVTRGVPVDEGRGHPITRPPAAVENLGKTCGRSCGRTVENLGTTRFIHRTPKLCTGFSTSPVDKNSGADLVKQGLSTVSTGPTTTAHLDQPSVASKRQRGKSVDNSPGATRPTSRQRQRGNPGNVWSRPCPPPPGSER
ncbi:hypothetical protein SAMN05421803_1269 [Nocardiopsis flavescens]|uniref:Uncharacterized protein n=1 Tax=Nocardiopsis flavescens TaxID=758803 RepID=A0A1M6U462_9ACTN|nr:hypothetical protein SAMN05421803_1269 [Nocardiopsis flavescens]